MTDGASLRSVSWVLSGCSLWALSLADFLSQRGKRIENVSEEDPLELGFFILGACALIWAAPLAQLAGSRLRSQDGFRLIQFFEGGLPSLLLQAFAWSCYATAVFACVMSLLNPSIRLKGLKTGLGLLGFASQALVNLSVDVFENPNASSTTEQFSKKLTKSKIIITSISSILATFALFATLLAEIGFFTDFQKPIIWNISMCCFTVGISLSAFFIRAEDEVSQVAQLFATLLLGCAFWIFARLHLTPMYASLKGSTVGLGIVGFLGALLSLYGLLNSPSSPTTLQISTPSSGKTSSIYRLSLLLLSFSIFARFSGLNSYLAALISLLGAPLAHYGTWLAFRLEDGFQFARALQGGVSFSIFQGVGWMAYAMAVLGVVTFTFASDTDLVSWGSPTWEDAGGFLHPIVLIAHISLLWAKQVFRKVKFTPIVTAEATIRTTPKNLQQPARQREEVRFSDQPEIIIQTKMQEDTDISPASPMESEDQRNSVIATPLVFLSIVFEFILKEYPGLSLLTSSLAMFFTALNLPAAFQGTPPVIVQQALGWTLFFSSLVGQGIILFNVDFWFEYDMLACLIRALGIMIVQTSKLNRFSKNHSKEPRKRKRTEMESDLDLIEITDLLERSKRPNVKAAMLRIKNGIESNSRWRRVYSILVGILIVMTAHLSFAMTLYADFIRITSWNSVFYFGIGSLFSFLSALSTHFIFGKLLHGREVYHFYQPFHGGVQLVILQAIGWTSLVTSMVAQLICFNYGLMKIEFNGIVTVTGFTSYAANILLLLSVFRFEPDAPHLGFAFDMDIQVKGLGLTLSMCALSLFVGVDLAIVRFGLQDTSLITPVIVCGWIAVAISVPLTYFLERKSPSRGGFGLIRVIGLAIWTFSLFLILFLLGRATTLTTQNMWLSSKTGFASVVAHGIISMSADPTKVLLFTQQYFFLIITMLFIFIMMPFIRIFLDYPMWYYAYFFKSWSHSRSPDGIHPMENAKIFRNIKYGENFMDVLVPENTTNGQESKENENEEIHAPIIWLHGGGHLFVQREILTHSMTPFCRAGLVVYAVEYPLSPESAFPHAIICILQAAKWIKTFHCRGGKCLTGGKPKICAQCESMEHQPLSSQYPCQCCSHNRGTATIQLLGDSAGGNLSAMVTAVLTNEHIRVSLQPYSGYSDFLEWKLPKVQRLGLIYGLLGRNLDLGNELMENASWTEWFVREGGKVTLNFLMKQYSGSNPALDGKVVLNDLRDDLVDFSPETLMLCGTADPLLATNRQALKIIREKTGRECELIEYKGAFHGYHGFPIQWTFGSWKNNAFPTTKELVKFFTGGKGQVADFDFSTLPKDYSPLFIVPASLFLAGVLIRLIWYSLQFGIENIIDLINDYKNV